MSTDAMRDSVLRNVEERRVKLLQSEIKVRDQISALKQRLDMTFLKLEQQALSDLRAQTGLEMLAIKKKEQRMLENDVEPESLAKVLSFHPDPFIERLESELTDLGLVKLVYDMEAKSDEMTIKPKDSILSEDSRSVQSSTVSELTIFESKHREKQSQTTIESTPSSTSGFVQVGRSAESIKTLPKSEKSSYCFVETGTLSRRIKQRPSILDKEEKIRPLRAPESVSTSMVQTEPGDAKTAGSVARPESTDFVFTVLKDNKIVTVDKSSGLITLYRPDFVLLTSVKLPMPLAICHHVAYDVIVIACREEDRNVVALLKTNSGHLECIDKLGIDCKGRVSCMAYSCSKLYVGCSGNHLHVFDENWEERKKIKHVQIGQTLISLACTETVFCFVGSDGSVTYVDSLGRYLAKYSVNAISVGFMSGKSFALCRENGIKVFEIPHKDDDMTEPKVVIKTGLLDVFDMHVSTENEEVAVLYWNEDNLDMTTFKLSN